MIERSRPQRVRARRVQNALESLPLWQTRPPPSTGEVRQYSDAILPRVGMGAAFFNSGQTPSNSSIRASSTSITYGRPVTSAASGVSAARSSRDRYWGENLRLPAMS